MLNYRLIVSCAIIDLKSIIYSELAPFEFVTVFSPCVLSPPDMPEVLWKAYIDFEIAEGENSNARELYTRLLERVNPKP